MTLFPDNLIDTLQAVGVVAGFSVDKPEHAQPIAEALLEGGLNVIELTLRTDAAFDALKIIIERVPDMVAGVGTILIPEQARMVKDLGADFGVSPGFNPAVVEECKRLQIPFAPGIVSPTNLEAAIALGCRFVKFFPAEPSGGLPFLRSMAAPYSHLKMRYFPLGGINNTNMIEYLKEPNVPTVGGSWIVDKQLVAEEDWAGITSRAQEVRTVVDALNKK